MENKNEGVTMAGIPYYILTREYCFYGKLIFATESALSKKEINKMFVDFVKTSKHHYLREVTKYSDTEIKKGMVIKVLPPPKSYPKFNNETPFQIKLNGKILKSPKITAIRWNGNNWEYQVEDIGHTYYFQPESTLEQI